MGKQTKRRTSKYPVEAPPKVESQQQVPITAATASLRTRWRSLVLPVVGLLLLGILLIGKDTDSIMHPWTRADMLCDSVGKIQNQELKNSMLEESGRLLKASITKHPYHARIWAIYGHYFVKTGNWDSSLICEKKAIELGKGSTINSIEPMAKYFMNIALKFKMEPVYKQKEIALKVLQDLEIPGYDNEVLNKFRGFVYVNNNEYDTANQILIKYLAKSPNDFDVLYAVAVNYTNQGMRSEALSYAYRARAVRPNSEQIQNIIRLNSQ